MPALPALEPREGLVLRLRPRDLDDRHGRPAAAGRGGRGAGTGGLRRGALLQLSGEALLHRGTVLLALRFGLGRVVLGGGAALLRWLDARRLAGLLPVVRWPRRIAEALGLVTPRH